MYIDRQTDRPIDREKQNSSVGSAPFHLLINGYRCSSPGLKRPGAWIWPYASLMWQV